MVFRPTKKFPDSKRLKTALLDSKISADNNALFQTINGLIDNLQTTQDTVSKELANLVSNQAPPNILIGRGSQGGGPLENIRLGDNLEMNQTTLDVTGVADWDIDITKSGLQDVHNTATVVNDTELLFPVLINEVWYVQLLLLYSGNSTSGDYKFDFSLPTAHGWIRYITDNSTADAIQVSTGIRLAGVTALAAQVSCGTDAAFTARTALVEMMFRAATTGNIQFQFANVTAALGNISRTYGGSVIRGKRLTGTLLGTVSGGSSGGGGGGGGISPTVPFPNHEYLVIAYDAANPAEILVNQSDWSFLDGVVADLVAADPRYAYNGKRGDVNNVSQDAIAYYYGTLPPVEGSNEVYVIDIIANSTAVLGDPEYPPTPAWTDVTTPAALGAWVSVRP